MQQLKLFLTVSMSFFLLNIGCQDDDGNTDPGTLTGEKISAKIDGVYWESTEAVAAYLSIDNTLNLAGGNLNPGPNISAYIRKPAGIGTFDFIERGGLTLTLDNKLLIAGINAFNGKTLGSGKITVTEIGPNSNIRGTFEGVVEDSDGNKKVITEGRFSGF